MDENNYRLISVIYEWWKRLRTWYYLNVFRKARGDSDTGTNTAPPAPTGMGKPDEIRASIKRLIDGLDGKSSQKAMRRLDKHERRRLSSKLQTLDDLVAGQEYHKSSSIDLYQGFHPAETEFRLAENAEKNIGLAISEVFRNILVLLPILFTWASLAVASTNYHQALDPEINTDEDKRAKMEASPFLLLWEQDFLREGKASMPVLHHRPTFSQVAEVDAWIILGAVLLTFWHHHQLNYVQAQRKTTAAEVRHHLEYIIWGASKLLSSAYIDKLSPTGVTQSYAEFTNALTDGTEKLDAAADKIYNASTALGEFKTIASNIERQQAALTQSVQALSSRVDALGNVAQTSLGVANHATATADSLAGLTDGLFDKFDAVAHNLRVDRGENKSFTTQMHTVARSLEESATRTEEVFGELRQTLDRAHKDLGSIVDRGYNGPPARPTSQWLGMSLLDHLIRIGLLAAIAGAIAFLYYWHNVISHHFGLA